MRSKYDKVAGRKAHERDAQPTSLYFDTQSEESSSLPGGGEEGGSILAGGVGTVEASVTNVSQVESMNVQAGDGQGEEEAVHNDDGEDIDDASDESPLPFSLEDSNTSTEWPIGTWSAFFHATNVETGEEVGMQIEDEQVNSIVRSLTSISLPALALSVFDSENGGNGKCDCNIATSTTPGPALIGITIDGNHVQGSPFKLLLVPGALSPNCSKVIMDAMDAKEQGRERRHKQGKGKENGKRK